MPDQGSFFVELTVLKELEDLRRPQMAIGAVVFDKQNAAVPPNLRDVARFVLPDLPFATATNVAQSTPAGRQFAPPPPSNWIPKGRDANLEQQILAILDLTAPLRLAGVIAPGGAVGLPPSFFEFFRALRVGNSLRYLR